MTDLLIEAQIVTFNLDQFYTTRSPHGRQMMKRLVVFYETATQIFDDFKKAATSVKKKVFKVSLIKTIFFSVY